VSETTHYLNIERLEVRIRASEISPVAVVDACLARIDALNDKLNAFATVVADTARERAREVEAEIRAGTWRGPLHGIPVGIKDFYDTAGLRTTAAFEHFRNRVPRTDAEAVAKLRKAGVVIVGKTNMHRLGMGTTGLDSCFGPVNNPWNAAYVPGGSSSGSAAAVAAGLCYATLDTDAIGSCRLPAACCGVVGFKGSYGLVSAKGILEGEKADETILWLAHPGITARSVADAAIVLKIVADPDEYVKISRGEPDADTGQSHRIGVVDNFQADAEVARVFDGAVEAAKRSGGEFVAARAPFDIPPFGDLRSIESDRRTISDRSFRGLDVLILPTTATSVPTVESARGNPQALSPSNTLFANYFGLPAISIPCGFDKNGLPVGLQIVGKPWGDGTVLRVARRFETALQSTERHPLP
jgi:aspartyl-tRNA(Asn)/glutamyl-tRNA(Gln) amidotransferase subunit A